MGDYRTTTGEAPPVSRRDQRRKLRSRLAVLIIAALLIFLVGMLVRVDRYVTAPGYVTTESYAEVRSAVVGKIADVVVRTGQNVEINQLMVQLDDSEEQALFEETVSQMRKVEAELARRQAEIEDKERLKEKNVAVATLRVEHAGARLLLTRELSEKGLAAGRALEDQELNEKVARAELDVLLAEDRTLPQKELAVLQEELQARRDAVARTEARVNARKILSPIAGRALRYEFVVGELVRPDVVLYEVFGGEGLILKLRVPERYAALIRSGQAYVAELLPYKQQRLEFRGEVHSLRNVIQSEQQRTYRTATCSFDDQGLPVPPGTTAEADIHVGRSSLWMALFGIY